MTGCERWNHNLHYHRVILDAIPARASRALDIDCGEGTLTRQLGSRVRLAQGIDLDAPSIDLARSTSPPSIDFVVGDFLTQLYEPGSFDIVASVAALHHVDARQGLSRMRELTAPGGVLAVIGLARSTMPRDLGREAAAVAVNRVLMAGRGYWEHSAPMVWPPPEDYVSMRRIALELLPGAAFRRHLLWRYTLVWRKPTNNGRPFGDSERPLVPVMIPYGDRALPSGDQPGMAAVGANPRDLRSNAGDDADPGADKAQGEKGRAMSTSKIDLDQGPTTTATETPVPSNPTMFVADPGPLGLAAFAGTTFVLSIFNSGMANDSGTSVVIGLALFYGGIGQLLAGMWEFRKNNTFGALAFTSYGAFWLSFAYLLRYTDLTTATDVNQALGVFVLMWTIFTAYMTVAALRVSAAVAAVFVVLTLTFACLTIGYFDTSTGWHHLGGYLGIVTAVLAWYASMAGVTNATWGRTVLPTMPLGNRPLKRGQ